MQEQEQGSLSDADLWEQLVKSGKSEQMATAMVLQRRKSFGGQGSTRQWEPEKPGIVSGMARAANQGMTFGLSDEMSAGLGAAGDKMRGQQFGASYTARVEGERGLDREFKSDHPVLGYGAEIAGGMATGKAIPQFAKMGAVKGSAAMGAAYGAGTAEGGLKERGTGAAVGGIVGGALGGTVAGVQSLRKNLPAAGAAIRRNAGSMRDVILAIKGDPTAVARLSLKAMEATAPKGSSAVGAAVPKADGLLTPEASIASEPVTLAPKAMPSGQTWTQFLKENMGPAMREHGGDHGAAIRALSRQWKARSTATPAARTLDDIAGNMDLVPEAPAAQTLEEVLASPNIAGHQLGPKLPDIVHAPPGRTASGRLQQGAPKARFEYWEKRLADRAAREAQSAEAAEPTLEDLLALSLDHVKKGGSMKSAADALKLVRRQ